MPHFYKQIIFEFVRLLFVPYCIIQWAFDCVCAVGARFHKIHIINDNQYSKVGIITYSASFQALYVCVCVYAQCRPYIKFILQGPHKSIELSAYGDYFGY